MIILFLGMTFNSSAEETTSEHWLEAYQEDMELFSFEGYRIQRYRSPTPPHSQFAQTLDTQGVITLRESNPDVVLLDVQPIAWSGKFIQKKGRERKNIEGSIWLPNVGLGELEDSWSEYFQKNLEKMTSSDKSQPIILYCTADCWMSWNAIKRAHEWGYTELYWLRNGTDGWLEAGFEVVTAKPEPFPYKEDKK